MSSVYYRILTTARDVIGGEGSIDDANVKVRRRPVWKDGDPLPLVVVSPVGETYDSESFEADICLQYPVRVTIISGNEFAEELGVQTQLDLRETIRRLLHDPDSLDVDEVRDCNVDLQPAFEPPVLPRGFDYSDLLFSFLSQEPRTVS